MIKREDYQLAIMLIGMFLFFIIIVAFISHDTYYRKPEIIKCIDACDSLLSIEDERLDILQLKEQCAEKCISIEATKQPIIYKAECECTSGSNWYYPYWDYYELGNYTFNLSKNNGTTYWNIPNTVWVSR